METTQTIQEPEVKKQRKAPIKKGLNELGKFFTKLRIDLDMTSADWCKELKVSNSFVLSIERDDNKITFDYAMKVFNLLKNKAPQFLNDIAVLIASELNVLVIPPHASSEAVEQAYLTLLHYDAQMAKQTQETHSVDVHPSV